METIDERLTGMLESFLFIAGDDGLTLSQIASLTSNRDRSCSGTR